jgi:hypothetical protein
MRAVYASAEGRKAARTAAVAISKEIMHKIQWLANPEYHEALLEAIRCTVKAAVGLWRKARLDWGMVYSSMPSSLLSGQTYSAGANDILFWIRPFVVHDRTCSLGEKSGEGDGDKHVQEVYLHGTALRRDSPLVLARRKELELELELESELKSELESKQAT